MQFIWALRGAIGFAVLWFAWAATAAEPMRVATLVPAVNPGFEADPARYEIVATVRRSMHAPPLVGQQDLGSPHAPSIELLVASQPDLVVGDASMHARLATQLEPLGLNVALVDTRTSDSLLAGLEQIAAQPPGSERLVEAAGQARRELKAQHLAKPVAVVAFFGVPGSFYLVSERWWLGEMMQQLGFENLVPDIPNERFPGLVPVNDERLALLRPEIVFLVTHGDPGAVSGEFQRMASQDGAWSGLAAPELGVHVLDPELFMATPALNAPSAARELVELGSGERP